ncbi:MAG: hypothetical protein KAG97_03125 [Victivallales bacterium]|nr:hypothetical protein [Victivallales bacterium]
MKPFYPEAESFYDKKFSKANCAVATKALAAKLSKCVYNETGGLRCEKDVRLNFQPVAANVFSATE